MWKQVIPLLLVLQVYIVLCGCVRDALESKSHEL